jgi:hypothetical protein
MSERDTPMYGHEVAGACGWSPAMMTASRAAGYKFLYGTKTTIRHYLTWRSKNPDFKITAYVLAHSKKKTVRAKGLSQRGRGRPVANAHNLDAQS